ncbi:MAG: zinc ribbon domain-containing protein [Oscillospiraceae bacterium]|nr:zinc ribbon domain-containing protein [Oscillospiraceae bacterium]
MKCTNCNTENLRKANYCKNCGQAFTQREKDAAHKQSVVGKLEKAEEIKGKADKVKDILSLSFITDNVWVRLALIVLPFVFSLVIGGGAKGGDTMKIHDNGQYDVYYNTTTQEYFVEIDSGSVNLSLYVPKGTQQINVYFKETTGYEYQSGSYGLEDAITVNENTNGYYTIEAVMENGTQTVRMYTI